MIGDAAGAEASRKCVAQVVDREIRDARPSQGTGPCGFERRDVGLLGPFSGSGRDTLSQASPSFVL